MLLGRTNPPCRLTVSDFAVGSGMQRRACQRNTMLKGQSAGLAYGKASLANCLVSCWFPESQVLTLRRHSSLQRLDRFRPKTNRLPQSKLKYGLSLVLNRFFSEAWIQQWAVGPCISLTGQGVSKLALQREKEKTTKTLVCPPLGNQRTPPPSLPFYGCSSVQQLPAESCGASPRPVCEEPALRETKRKQRYVLP